MIAFLVGLALGLGFSAPAPAPVHHGGTRITEDDPRWDCHTMGNRVCGRPTR